MKLLAKTDYDKVEELLRVYCLNAVATWEEPYKKAIDEIIEFFNVPVYNKFLELFYFRRNEYKNRYPDNRSMFNYLCQLLYVQEPTLYMMRKEIIYKSAMIFYKYNLI